MIALAPYPNPLPRIPVLTVADAGLPLARYQVCGEWLKDHEAKGGKNPRPGRVLADEDIDHYQKIVVALSETIRIMAEIDEVIDAHGGRPDAFVTERCDESTGTAMEE